MTAYRKVGECHGPGGRHDMFPTREDAKTWARTRQARWGGRGKAYRCQFCEHFHVTRSILGKRSTRERRGGRK